MFELSMPKETTPEQMPDWLDDISRKSRKGLPVLFGTGLRLTSPKTNFAVAIAARGVSN